MTLYGAGASSAGASYAGVGTFAGVPQAAGAIYVDDLGIAQGSPYIDPYTRQPVYLSNGRRKGMANTQHLVFLALNTLRGSSVSGPNFGLDAPGGVIDTGFVARRTAAIQTALSALTSQGAISIISIDIDTAKRPVFTRIRWQDLLDKNEREITF